MRGPAKINRNRNKDHNRYSVFEIYPIYNICILPPSLNTDRCAYVKKSPNKADTERFVQSILKSAAHYIIWMHVSDCMLRPLYPDHLRLKCKCLQAVQILPSGPCSLSRHQDESSCIQGTLEGDPPSRFAQCCDVWDKGISQTKSKYPQTKIWRA